MKIKRFSDLKMVIESCGGSISSCGGGGDSSSKISSCGGGGDSSSKISSCGGGGDSSSKISSCGVSSCGGGGDSSSKISSCGGGDSSSSMSRSERIARRRDSIIDNLLDSCDCGSKLLKGANFCYNCGKRI